MSSQELPQSQRQELESASSMETTMQQAEAVSSKETATQEAEPKQEVASSEPAVPSSDAILPSSPSPAKHPTNEAESSNTDTSSRKRPADDIDSNPDNIAPPPDPAPTAPPNANPTLHPLHQKLTALQSHLHNLQTLYTSHLHTHSTLPSSLPLPTNWTPMQIQTSALETAHAVIKEHIALLHGYNEIKDVGMGLLGLVAEKRGVRVRCVMEEFGVGEGD
ncbi:hypothetical protein M409DRAFT_60467 [Zasmidium cellare ATCC 36951]|uniref:Swi5-domain-containing protein n=1 Tax=Zasmidium cellare ATCC 36951 TaxID=1080233 RepID=A0A6A6BYJ9_ZASCE|nr:uncharacterized protein M409DRAFT_60467 [Zasmidium cellare ATCC 36951]KAF2159874.1 hypothetical protein M409DRAFT_60467 [Zasmidium cellare ATCC 36951]